MLNLKTNTKIFSSAPSHFGAEPNANIHVTDLAYPGVLPVFNKSVVDFGMKAAMALNCDIADVMHFDRKHYFYPDNPKAYQISQEDRPIGEHGWVEIEVDGKKKKIGIDRIHLRRRCWKINAYRSRLFTC